ncbi:MAG TPA: hypothetical protein VM261_37060 [Kofleriaceae bacterium]|nr:hypothetical protein [Kofleriaceae bacterium]
MRTRRAFLRLAFGGAGGGVLVACSGGPPGPGDGDGDGDGDDDDDGSGDGDGVDAAAGSGGDAAPSGGDAAPASADAAACTTTVTLYDVYAMALYFDGGLGPRTGTIRVADVAAGITLPKDFWHGHGGQLHRFTVLPEHFAALKRRERVMIQTSEVDGHSHMLFVDPVDPQWRVEGAQPQTIPAC